MFLEEGFGSFNEPSLGSFNIDKTVKYKTGSTAQPPRWSDGFSSSQPTEGANSSQNTKPLNKGIDACTYVSIVMLQSAKKESKDNSWVLLNGKEIGFVSLCGWICSVEKRTSITRFVMNDGTGTLDIECSKALKNHDAVETPGTLVAVYGMICMDDQRNIFIDAHKFHIVQDPIYYALYHPLSIIRSTLQNPNSAIEDEKFDHIRDNLQLQFLQFLAKSKVESYERKKLKDDFISSQKENLESDNYDQLLKDLEDLGEIAVTDNFVSLST